METIVKLMISGYVVGLACMGYLLLRSCELRVNRDANGPVVSISREIGVNWFGVSLFSMVISYTWCLIGAMIHFFMDSNMQFLQFSVLFALVSSITIYSFNTSRQLDKIAINGIVVLGTCLMFVHLF